MYGNKSNFSDNIYDAQNARIYIYVVYLRIRVNCSTPITVYEHDTKYIIGNNYVFIKHSPQLTFNSVVVSPLPPTDTRLI